MCYLVVVVVRQHLIGSQVLTLCPPFRNVSRLQPVSLVNSLAQVPFEGVLVEAYKGTRRKHNMKFRQIGHTTSQYGQSFIS